ncbi:DUF4276 family protein [Emticicia agri]|uniref:DUF4276 family protein n=1 Tax=Emticicia agri TaxID=2492393 RepID=A0A4Q5M3V1_9BACT|nr:DUF4276 family protein [Emticicia agri]RYU97008.1 DUF4276 family protein [Emticicia agri]
MKRIIIICEGETEQTFCNRVLQPYFQERNIHIQAALIKRSKGGIVSWPILKKEIEIYLKSDIFAIVTTFIDYYGLFTKLSFPEWKTTEKIADPNARMDSLESNIKKDIHIDLNDRFIPYIQLHEFEGLLFNDIHIIYEQIPIEDIVNKKELERTFKDYDNPEMINTNRETSPSHRLARIIKGYDKVVYGDILSEAIGLHRIRNKAPRFNEWISKLENI